jgi:hypothetical protein
MERFSRELVLKMTRSEILKRIQDDRREMAAFFKVLLEIVTMNLFQGLIFLIKTVTTGPSWSIYFPRGLSAFAFKELRF